MVRAQVSVLVVALGLTVPVIARAELPAPAASRDAATPLPKNLVLADLGLHVVGLGYQRTLSPWLAGQIDVDSYTPWTATDGFFDVRGIVLRARAVFYPWQAAPTGVWLSPFEQCGPASGDRGKVNDSGFACAVGASAGYSVLVARVLHVSLGVGAQYHVVHLSGGASAPAFRGFHQQLDASVGYAF